MSDTVDRLIGVGAGLFGALGVAAMAAGAHAFAGGHVDLAGQMLVMHAAALMALARPSAGSDHVRRVAALTMALGVALFSADIVCRAALGGRLFPMAAPTGGVLTILAWLVVGGSFVLRRR